MSDHVWVSKARIESGLVGDFYTDILVKDRDLTIQGQKLNEKGQSVPEAMCPENMGRRRRPVFR